MHVQCPHCKRIIRRKHAPSEGRTITCTCGSVFTYQGNGHFHITYPDREELVPRGMEQWLYPTYLEAKAAAVELFTPEGEEYPICAICGSRCVTYQICHHALVSRRYSLRDVRNLVILCSPFCHEEAHGAKAYKCREALVRAHGEEEIQHFEEEHA